MVYSLILILFSIDAVLLYTQSARCVKSTAGSIALKTLCFIFIMSNINLIVFFSYDWRLTRGENFLFAHTVFMFAYLAFVLKGSARVQNLWCICLRFLRIKLRLGGRD